MSRGTAGWTAHDRDRAWSCEPPSAAAAAFHRSLDGYAPTPLVDLPGIAAELGVGRVLAKEESSRLGLPAFKALGASWAIRRVLDSRPDERQLTLVTATDGNHGRAVARFGRLLGHRAEIVVPRGVSAGAIAAIEAEGAAVTVLDGSYDDAVTAAARLADSSSDAVLVQDTAWEGYEEIPAWIVEGYGTLLVELDEQAEALDAAVDLVMVPTGVGSLLQAVLTHYRSSPAAGSPAVVAVEPDVAAGLPASLAAGHPVTVETGVTTMAGLNCGTPSALAWPFIEHGLDGVVTVTDRAAATAARDLAAAGVDAGPCGAASLAALRAVLTGGGAEARARHLGLDADSTVALLITEGAASTE